MYVHVVIEHEQDESSDVRKAFYEKSDADGYVDECSKKDAKAYKDAGFYNKAWEDPEWVKKAFYSVVPIEVE